MRQLSTQQFRIGTPVMKMEFEEFIISLQSVACVPGQMQEFLGLKSKQALQLLGSTLVVFYRVKIPLVNFSR